MTKLCILIGEGPSERHFLPSLLQGKLGFLPLEEKSPHLFQKDEGLFWFFPFPPLSTNPGGGKARLKRTETFRTANVVVENKKYIYGDAEIHYRIIVDHISTDKEGQQNQKEEITAALRNSGVPFSGCRVDVVENELECWYFAGLNEQFPFLNKSANPLLKRLLTEEPERISDPKGNIKAVLSADVHGAIKMAEIMGKYFDIEKARLKSPSFESFIAGLEGDGLL